MSSIWTISSSGAYGAGPRAKFIASASVQIASAGRFTCEDMPIAVSRAKALADALEQAGFALWPAGSCFVTDEQPPKKGGVE